MSCRGLEMELPFILTFGQTATVLTSFTLLSFLPFYLCPQLCFAFCVLLQYNLQSRSPHFTQFQKVLRK